MTEELKMKDVVSKFAIALGDEWFTGFRSPVWQDISEPAVVGRGDSPKLLDEDELRLAMADLKKLKVRERAVYHADFTKFPTIKEIRIARRT
jgi:hypothetical protein